MTTDLDYAPLDAVVAEAVAGSEYSARAHSHAEVMSHADHCHEFGNMSTQGIDTMYCHDCKIAVAF